MKIEYNGEVSEFYIEDNKICAKKTITKEDSKLEDGSVYCTNDDLVIIQRLVTDKLPLFVKNVENSLDNVNIQIKRIDDFNKKNPLVEGDSLHKAMEVIANSEKLNAKARKLVKLNNYLQLVDAHKINAENKSALVDEKVFFESQIKAIAELKSKLV